MITTTKIRALLNDIGSDITDKFGQAICALINPTINNIDNSISDL